MLAFLARHIDMSAGATQRLEQLVTALDDERSFGLRYTDATRTAPETFRSRDGNCLALTNLFVALARGARGRNHQGRLRPRRLPLPRADQGRGRRRPRGGIGVLGVRRKA